jgi:TonB-linked SusC/RagA family outer membrane protein
MSLRASAKTLITNNDTKVSELTQQPVTVTGTVTDENGDPLPGLTVAIKGTTRGTVTNLDGKYTIEIEDRSSTLIFSYVGYITQEIQVGDQATIDIRMNLDVFGLEEVVVVGFGKQDRVTVTGAVSAIQNEELVKSPQANLSNSLVGRMTGIIARQESAEPGEDYSTIRIRGVGTFAGSQEPLILVDGVQVDNYNNIDPNDVENISILKDASATAVYGVKGANGVMLITTKRGQTGKPVFSYTSNIAGSTIIDMREYSESYDWAKGWNEALMYDSYVNQTPYVAKFTDEELSLFRSGADPIFYPNTNWIDLMMKKWAFQQHHNLNVSGGTEKIKYFISGGIFDQGGHWDPAVFNPEYDSQSEYKRYNLRTNFDFDVTDRLSVSVNLATQFEERKGPAVGFDAGNMTSQVFANMERVPPAMSPGWVDGKIVELYDYFGGNPLFRLLSGVNEQYNNYLSGTFRVNYKLDFITQGLSVHGTTSYRNFNIQNRFHGKGNVSYKPTKLTDGTINYVPDGYESPFGFSESSSADRNSYAEFGFDYVRAFGDHNVTGLVLYNQEKQVSPNLEYLVPHGYQGLVGRVTYDYKRRYLAEVNLGYNGTENFAPGKRFGLFPAYSLGWVVTEEPFFPDNQVVSFIKLRGSYGEVGNDQIGGSRFLYRPSSYRYGRWDYGYWFGNVATAYNRTVGASEDKIGNPDLTWERAKKLDLGVELRLWNDKIMITADWFNETRDNILAIRNTVPVTFGANRPAYDFPVMNGYFLPAVNIGEMENKGYDGDITYNDAIGNFNFWVKANITYAHNTVIYQDEVPREYEYQYEEGQRYGQLWGLLAQGYYNTWDAVNDYARPVSTWNNDRLQPGDLNYKDVNGDGYIDSDDIIPIGYSNFPETIYGFSFGGSLKGFDFSILFQGATNVSMQYSKRTTRGWQEEGGTVIQIIEEAWTQERYDGGMVITHPRPSILSYSGHNSQSSSWDIDDATYLRLKNAEVGYSLPADVLSKVHLLGARIFVNANNLLTFTGVFPGEDPENPPWGDVESYPLTMTINGGINIKF